MEVSWPPAVTESMAGMIRAKTAPRVHVLACWIALALLICLTPAVVEAEAEAEAVGVSTCHADAVSKDDGVAFSPSKRTAKTVAFYTSYAGNFNGHDAEDASNPNIYGSEFSLIHVAENIAAARPHWRVVVFTRKPTLEPIRGVYYLHESTLEAEASSSGGPFDAIIISRYLNFFMAHRHTVAHRIILWLHDAFALPWYTAKLQNNGGTRNAVLSDEGKILLTNVAANIDAVVSVSHFHKRMLVDYHGLPADMVVAIPNGIPDRLPSDDALTPSPEEKIPNSFVYSSAPVRGLDVALRMFPRIVQNLPNATLHVFYSDLTDAPELLALARALPPGAVQIHGKVGPSQLQSRLRRMEYWLYPAKFCETSCIAAYETAAAGVLQITSSTCALAETVSGVVVNGTPGTSRWEDDALDALRRLAGSPELRAQVLERQRAFAEGQTWSNRTPAWLELIETGRMERGRNTGNSSAAAQAAAPDDGNGGERRAAPDAGAADEGSASSRPNAAAPHLERALTGFREYRVDRTNEYMAFMSGGREEKPTEEGVAAGADRASDGPSAREAGEDDRLPRPRTNICLNMIVKDESRVIRRLIRSVKDYIDYYVIADTGSTDGTPQIVREEMGKYQIDGQVHSREWVNFGVNRQQALDLALESCPTDYVLFIDADDELVVTDPAFYENLGAGVSYDVEIRSGGLRHVLNRLVNVAASQWRWEKPVHEYLTLVGGSARRELLVGAHVKRHIHEGARSVGVTMEEKYLRDAALLEEELRQNPNDSRCQFYLGRSYADAGHYEEAVEAYRKLLMMEVWVWEQERYYAQLELGRLAIKLGKPEQTVVDELLVAFDMNPYRVEPLYELARYFRLKDELSRAYDFAVAGVNISEPDDDQLFLAKDVYDWKMLDELGSVAFYAGRFLEGRAACEKILRRVSEGLHIEEDNVRRVMRNLEFYPIAMSDAAAAGSRGGGIHDEIPIFVVNLDRRRDRWNTFVESFEQAGVPLHNVHRFSAVDGSRLGAFPYLRKYLFANNDFNFSVGVLGCALSNLNIWHMLTNNEVAARGALVLEDDVILTPRFAERLQVALQQFNESMADLAYFGCNPVDAWDISADIPGSRKRQREAAERDGSAGQRMRPSAAHTCSSLGSGTFAYAISRTGARKLESAARRKGFQRAVDCFMPEQWQDLDVHTAWPPLFFADVAFASYSDANYKSDVQGVFKSAPAVALSMALIDDGSGGKGRPLSRTLFTSRYVSDELWANVDWEELRDGKWTHVRRAGSGKDDREAVAAAVQQAHQRLHSGAVEDSWAVVLRRGDALVGGLGVDVWQAGHHIRAIPCVVHDDPSTVLYPVCAVRLRRSDAGVEGLVDVLMGAAEPNGLVSQPMDPETLRIASYGPCTAFPLPDVLCRS